MTEYKQPWEVLKNHQYKLFILNNFLVCKCDDSWKP